MTTNLLLDPRIGPMTKSDMQYQYPAGAAQGDNPALRGHPDRDLLNRHESYEVRWFANNFELTHLKGIINRERLYGEVAKKVERMLHTVVPTNLRSHAHIEDWLVRNWDMFPNA